MRNTTVFPGVFSCRDKKNVDAIALHVKKLITRDPSENYVRFSPFNLITDESEYNHSAIFKQQYDEDTRWVAYKLIKDLYYHMSDISMADETYGSINNTTVVVNSDNYSGNDKSEQVLELERVQRDLVYDLSNMPHEMSEKICSWFTTRNDPTYTQPFSLAERFREEIVQYVNDGYLEFVSANNALAQSFRIDTNNQQMVEYSINNLNDRQISRKYFYAWYPPTVVDFLERETQYKQIANKAMGSTLNSIANGIADLFRITTSLDEPNSILYTRKPLRYPFISDRTIMNFRKEYESDKDLNPKWNDIKTPDEKMLSMLFEYADSPDKKHFACTILGRKLHLDRFIS